MKVFNNKVSLENFITEQKKNNTTIGLVPTMGALHEGHISLVKKAKEDNAIVVVSIFVNPTQFDKQEDLIKYPKTLKEDIKKLEEVNCDVLFTPSANDLYDNNIASENFNFEGIDKEMEGKFRIGHFDGVGTVVKKLLLLVKPNKAYFGEKDFQQLQVVKKLVENEKIATTIVGCPIFREPNGLAMSSRNKRLSKEEKNRASLIYKTLQEVKSQYEIKSLLELEEYVKNEFNKEPSLDLEYFTVADESTLKPILDKKESKNVRAFISVYSNTVRLIDNVQIPN